MSSRMDPTLLAAEQLLRAADGAEVRPGVYNFSAMKIDEITIPRVALVDAILIFRSGMTVDLSDVTEISGNSQLIANGAVLKFGSERKPSPTTSEAGLAEVSAPAINMQLPSLGGAGTERKLGAGPLGSIGEAAHAKFLSLHPGLTLEGLPDNRIGFAIEDGAVVDVEAAARDLEFLLMNPNIPLESIGCTLNNYRPQNESQREALDHARSLLRLSDLSRPSGLFIDGPPGVGKSHLSVGLAKEFLGRGMQVTFVTPETIDRVPYRGNMPDKPSVWILDDFNTPFGGYRDKFVQVLLHLHNLGGVLFVTSNEKYREIMPKVYSLVGGDGARVKDRVEAILTPFSISGDSMRNPF